LTFKHYSYVLYIFVFWLAFFLSLNSSTDKDKVLQWMYFTNTNDIQNSKRIYPSVVASLISLSNVVCSVLYISIHREDLYPAGNLSAVGKVGAGKGTGFNVNIPWTKVQFIYFIWLSVVYAHMPVMHTWKSVKIIKRWYYHHHMSFCCAAIAVVDIMLLLLSDLRCYVHQGGMADIEYLSAFQQIVMPVAYEVCVCVFVFLIYQHYFVPIFWACLNFCGIMELCITWSNILIKKYKQLYVHIGVSAIAVFRLSAHHHHHVACPYRSVAVSMISRHFSQS